MRRRAVLCLLVLSAGGCTFTDHQNVVEGDFHPPIVTQHWHTVSYTERNGSKVCTVTSGPNGMTVLLRTSPQGMQISAKSNHVMEPGAEFTVNAGGDSITMADELFPPDTAKRVVSDFSHGGFAYLEWAEFIGAYGAQRVRTQNIVPLDEFNAQYASCQTMLQHLPPKR